jgi:hypothetical protein
MPRIGARIVQLLLGLRQSCLRQCYLGQVPSWSRGTEAGQDFSPLPLGGGNLILERARARHRFVELRRRHGVRPREHRGSLPLRQGELRLRLEPSNLLVGGDRGFECCR